MSLRLALIFALALFSATISTRAQTSPPRLSEADRTRLAEAFRLAAFVGDRVWQGQRRAPFAVLLVTPETEFLIRHPKPGTDFTPAGYDPVLRSEIHTRSRKLSPNLLATFPAVGGVPTIVVGTAENTGKDSTAWVVTLLHEHFHQLQDSQPDAYAAALRLGLARGDTTGMWMLNFPFPYGERETNAQFSRTSRALVEAIRAGRSGFPARLDAYFAERRRLQEMLAPDDYKYLSFQLWKEGVARYTEMRVARLAARGYRPSAAFRRLPDDTSYREFAARLEAGIMGELEAPRLADRQRVAFYALGAGEALLLDRSRPEWRRRYFAEPFDTGRYFAPRTARSGVRSE